MAESNDQPNRVISSDEPKSDESRKWQPKLRWLGAEISVVVLGVLIALTVNSWWSGIQDASLANSYLSTLQTDLRTAQISLENALIETRSIRDTASVDLRHLHSNEEVSPDLELRRIYWPGLPSLPTATLEALLETGDINLLFDAAVRSAIVNERAALNTEEATLDRLYELAAINIRDDLFVRAQLRREAKLPQGIMTIRVARQSSRIVATLELHRGMAQNRINALLAMRQSIARLDSVVAESLSLN